MKVKMLQGETWYGACAEAGINLPFDMKTKYSVNLQPNQTANQASPLVLSSHGRYVWGEDGLNIKFIDDKHYETLPTPEGMSYGTFRVQQTLPQGPCLSDENSPTAPRTETNGYKISQDEKNGYIQYATNKVNPIMPLTVEEADELAIIEADIGDYREKFEAACISGQKDIDKEWSTYLTQLDKYGFSKMLKIFNDTLAR